MRVAAQRFPQTDMDAGNLTSTVPEFHSDRTSMNIHEPHLPLTQQCASSNQYLPCVGKPSTLFDVPVPIYSVGFYHLKRCNTFLLIAIFLQLGFPQSSWA